MIDDYGNSVSHLNSSTIASSTWETDWLAKAFYHNNYYV